MSFWTKENRNFSHQSKERNALNTSGEEIQSMEVITYPPAKHEASGSAVLNIVMKQAKLEGYKGSLSGRFIQLKYAKGAVTTSHPYKKNKF